MRHAVRAIVVLLIVALGGGAFIYVSNLRLLDRRHAVAPVSIAAASGAEAVQRGKHLADITGCTDCHRSDLRGGIFADEGWLRGRYYASNLTLKAQRYSDADLARIVRLGVRPDGRGVVAMPSFGFVRLTDGETADLIAFVRSLPAGGIEQPDHHIGPLDQWDLFRGREFRPAVTYVDDERKRDPVDVGVQHAAGRHLVGIVCAECHGGDLTGNGWESGAPDLAVVRAYGIADLTRLLRTGTALGDRQLGLMTKIATDRLHKLSDQEIADIHAYLLARATLAQR